MLHGVILSDMNAARNMLLTGSADRSAVSLSHKRWGLGSVGLAATLHPISVGLRSDAFCSALQNRHQEGI